MAVIKKTIEIRLPDNCNGQFNWSCQSCKFASGSSKDERHPYNNKCIIFTGTNLASKIKKEEMIS